MKRILVTGISGSGRKELMKVMEGIAREGGASSTTAFIDVGEMIDSKAKEFGLWRSDKVSIWNTQTTRMIRNIVFQEIESICERFSTVMVGLHATFRPKHNVIPGFSMKDLEHFCPTKVINVSTDLDVLRAAHKQNSQWRYLDDYHRGIWADEEALVSRMIAERFDSPYYSVTSQHPHGNLSMLFFDNPPMFYLSYPITQLVNTPEVLDGIRDVGRNLSSSFVVFDPLDWRDMDYIAPIGDDTRKIDDLPKGCEQQIIGRTIATDYQLIEQSDFVVVVYPTDKVSSGVMCEMAHAVRSHKPVYVINDGYKGIFFDAMATEKFDDYDSLKRFLIPRYLEGLYEV